MAYAIGLLPFVLVRSVSAAFLARGDTATPVKALFAGVDRQRRAEDAADEPLRPGRPRLRHLGRRLDQSAAARLVLGPAELPGHRCTAAAIDRQDRRRRRGAGRGASGSANGRSGRLFANWTAFRNEMVLLTPGRDRRRHLRAGHRRAVSPRVAGPDARPLAGPRPLARFSCFPRRIDRGWASKAAGLFALDRPDHYRCRIAPSAICWQQRPHDSHVPIRGLPPPSFCLRRCWRPAARASRKAAARRRRRP